MSDVTERTAGEKSKTGLSWLFKVGTWALTLLCFYLVFNRTEATAALEGLTVTEYLLRFFQDADWTAWLMVMIPYSLFFFSVDSRKLARYSLVQCASAAPGSGAADSRKRLYFVPGQRTSR